MKQTTGQYLQSIFSVMVYHVHWTKYLRINFYPQSIKKENEGIDSTVAGKVKELMSVLNKEQNSSNTLKIGLIGFCCLFSGGTYSVVPNQQS
jgi:hypothetical protein